MRFLTFCYKQDNQSQSHNQSINQLISQLCKISQPKDIFTISKPCDALPESKRSARLAAHSY